MRRAEMSGNRSLTVAALMGVASSMGVAALMGVTCD